MDMFDNTVMQLVIL